MNMMQALCAPGYPVSGGAGAFTAEYVGAHVARAKRQWMRHVRNTDVVRVQTLVITDVPAGSLSALSFVRRS